MSETANSVEAEAEEIQKSDVLPQYILGEVITFYNGYHNVEFVQEISWFGLVAAEWKHTINQKTFGISNYVNGLRRSLNKKPPSAVTDEVLQTLGQIEKIVQNIREIQFIHFLALISHISDQTMIDEELEPFIKSRCRHDEDIKIVFDLNCPTIAVNIPPYWLQIALEKLVSNALKAMPTGGTLTISTELVEAQVNITIKDTGVGIPASVRPYFLSRVIPEEQRQTSSGSGSGSGVMIARSILLKHQGDIKLVKSSPTEGTELCIRLPMA